jgi:caffeoyl-CoA O-methyltransferase
MESKRAAWMMGGITEAPVEEYLYGLLPERDAVLNAIEQQAAERNIPIVGPAVGRLLYLLARSIGARTVFEMGSAVGYSTIWWARALGEGGRVVYTDGDRRNADEARRNFESARVLDKIDIRVGDALEILSEQRAESFDIIFNDVDKQDYPRVFKLAVPRLRKGGLFISDNVLWSGRVAQAGEKDESTAAIREFNRLLYGSRELYTSVLPLRDGVSVSLKL